MNAEREVKSCGVILFRQVDGKEFLLLRRPDRYDFAKGHVERGETELQCALRELEEETGVPPHHVQLDPTFRFTLQYPVWDKYIRARARKTLVLFLGWLQQPRDLVVSEHEDYEWRPWQPPHRIQQQTIDPALAALAEFWQQASA
ncbi:MAG: NUDIX domain-containing protein [Pirellulales bacterium]